MNEKSAASSSSCFDVAVIGGGPAGVSCAVWLAWLGFRPVVLEASDRIGGLCRDNPYADPWTVCLPPGSTGDDIAKNLASSIRESQVPVRFGFRVAEVVEADKGFTVCAEDKRQLQALFVVIASGVRARGLSMAEGQAMQPGVLVGPGGHILSAHFQGKRVAVLGGGDNGFENALYARSRGAACVHLYARTVRAQQQFVARMPATDVHQGSYQVDAANLQVNGQPYDLLLVFYGWEPCAGFASGLGLERTARGHLAAHSVTAETNVTGVFAIGEVTQRLHPCVVTAMADGVVAAKAIQARLEAKTAGKA